MSEDAGAILLQFVIQCDGDNYTRDIDPINFEISNLTDDEILAKVMLSSSQGFDDKEKIKPVKALIFYGVEIKEADHNDHIPSYFLTDLLYEIDLINKSIKKRIKN